MLPRQLSILPLVLLYLASGVKSSNVKITKFNQTYHNVRFAHDHYRFKYTRDSSWTYASCDKFNSERDTSMKCSIVLETNKPDGRVYREICQMKLENPKADEITESHMRVFRFGSDKSIVVWQNRNNSVHLYTVHFPTCKIVEAASTIDLEEPLFNVHDADENIVRVFPYAGDTYDVFYLNKTLNKEITYHRVRFDSDGNQLDYRKIMTMKDTEDIGEADCAGGGVFEVEDPDMGGYLMATLDVHYIFTFWHIGKSEKKDELLSYTWYEDKVFHHVILSTVNGIFGVCHSYTSNAILTCEQTNRQGQKILSTKFGIGYPVKNSQHWMYNLREGGFLMFGWPCSERQQCENDSHLYVTKVDANGTRYRTLQVMDYPHKDFRARDGFFENGPGEFCWHQLITDTYKPHEWYHSAFTYEITLACFTEEMVSEPYGFRSF